MSTDYSAHTVVGLRVPRQSVPRDDFQVNGHGYRTIQPFTSWLDEDRASGEVIVTPTIENEDPDKEDVTLYASDAVPNGKGPPGDGLIQRFIPLSQEEMDDIQQEMLADFPGIEGATFGIWTVLRIC